MINKCMGCGAILQTVDSTKEGFIQKDLSKTTDILCERCFRIKNYGEYKQSLKTNVDFIPILEKINTTKDLVILVIDLFNIPKDLDMIWTHISNPILLVLTKRDILPLSVSDKKLLNYFKGCNSTIVDSVIISSFKNYNFDILFEKIHTYKKTNSVYVVGYTNAGKSTMINKIIYNYFNKCREVTTSILPSTTVNTIEIQFNELTLIDTPGLLDIGSMIHHVDYKVLKRIIPKREINPITYQVKEKQTIYIDELVRIDVYNKGSITFYISNQLKVERTFKDTNKLSDLIMHKINVEKNQDIVIAGLGFIKCVDQGEFDIYTVAGVSIYTRDNLI